MATIAFVGNFTQPYCTETHLANTFTRLGHSVSRIQEDQIVPGTLVNRVKDHDLFFWVRTWPGFVTLEDIELIRGLGIITINYHLDLFVGLARQEGLDYDPRWRTDFVFSPDGDEQSAKIFKEKGINHIYIKPGVDKAECYLAREKPIKDVIFVGSYLYHPEYMYRQTLIDWLRRTYEGFEFWGPQGKGLVRNDDLNHLYASTKVVVGDSLILPNHTHYWSDRVYETLGRGGFLIHPYVKGLEEEFKDKKHLIYYELGNFDNLKFKIDYYLKHDKEREKIRREGHRVVKKSYTYDERLKQMLALTRGKK